MHKIKKLQSGNIISNIGTTPMHYQIPQVLQSNLYSGPFATQNVPNLNPQQTSTDFFQLNKTKNNTHATQNLISSIVAQSFANKVSDKIFDDSEMGRNLGTIFSSGLGSAGNTILSNIVKGENFLQGVSQNVGASIAGTAAGLGANYIGQGITSLMGNSKLGKFTGQATATTAGTIGSQLAVNAITKNSAPLFSSTRKYGLGAAKGSINPYALGATAIGMGLSAATGPSHEYEGRYGNITKTMDTVYDYLQTGVSFVPIYGQAIAAGMALNKGLSNIFGSTDGMTKQDAILGSAFMPAPVKWLNMIGARRTGDFYNQSWQNTERANSFMQNSFGNLGEKFDKAREESAKKYGGFSQGARRRAQRNIDFANYAWDKILEMADQNEYQNIRSEIMSSINNQRYAQNILGGWTPLARGKQGMKIFNNATNHNLGMRLLSGAALIDNKQMMLCNVVD